MANRKPSAALSNVTRIGAVDRPQAWGGQGGTARIGHKNKMAVRDFASRLHPMADERPRITVMSARTATASRWWSAGRRARGRGARASTDGRRTRTPGGHETTGRAPPPIEAAVETVRLTASRVAEYGQHYVLRQPAEPQEARRSGCAWTRRRGWPGTLSSRQARSTSRSYNKLRGKKQFAGKFTVNQVARVLSARWGDLCCCLAFNDTSDCYERRKGACRLFAGGRRPDPWRGRRVPCARRFSDGFGRS